MPRKRKTQKTAKSIYSRVTDKIIADLAKGVRPWIKPWSAEHTEGRITRPLRYSGLPYSGINVLMLWSASVEHGYDSPTWMTYRQAAELGGQVRKGEKGSLVVYANRMTIKDEAEDGEEQEREVRFLKSYTVFNTAQIDGLPERYYVKPEPRFPNAVERIEHAERFFEATGAQIRYGGNRAYYAPASDHIQIPPFEAFRDAEKFYGVLGHETVHWSGAKDRLARGLEGSRFGSESYGREELIAELGAAFLCADLEITPEVREDHSAYLASWLRILEADERAIFSAAAQAQRAVEYLHGLQASTTPEEKCPVQVAVASARPVESGSVPQTLEATA